MTTELKNRLRQVAVKFDDPDEKELFDCGICYAVANTRMVSRTIREPYDRVDDLLKRAEQGWKGGVLESYTGKKGWRDRATMCLLLAHWLEDEGF